LIDTNYKDIIPETRVLEKSKREFKIYTSDIIGNRYSMSKIREKVYLNYRNIINTNAFTKEYTQNDVSRPPESIMSLMEQMMKDPETDLGKVIFNHFRKLMNNRIGTLLKKDIEVPNIRDATGPFKPGEIAVQVVEEDLYKFCLVVGLVGNDQVEIITRKTPESDDFVNQTVRKETLKQYSPSEKIEQNFVTTGEGITDEKLLETYVIN